MDLKILALYLSIGIIGETLIDALGSIASRKFNFNYSRLAVFSILLYLSTGYLIARDFSLSTALISNGLIGFYGGTIGVWISIRLKANAGIPQEEYVAMVQGPQSLLGVTIVSILLALIGFVIKVMVS